MTTENLLTRCKQSKTKMKCACRLDTNFLNMYPSELNISFGIRFNEHPWTYMRRSRDGDLSPWKFHQGGCSIQSSPMLMPKHVLLLF